MVNLTIGGADPVDVWVGPQHGGESTVEDAALGVDSYADVKILYVCNVSFQYITTLT